MACSFGLCGCVTEKLWENKAFDGFNQPAQQANLQVSKCESDWLVEYDEAHEDSAHVRRRAYLLHANGERVREKKTPRFVTGTVATSGEVRAVISEDGREFQLYDGETLVGRYELPVYPRPSGRVKQILLTPFTVVADTAIVGATGALIVGSLWLKADASCPH